MIEHLIGEIEKRIRGKRLQVKLCIAGFLANGHILIEDIPGVGKTTLAKSVAQALGLEFKRVQFTSDLLPSDILGINYFDAKSSSFILKKGAIFSEFLLADEINRATPKTQSALLEALEERQVTIDTKSLPLPHNFFVIATQNPLEDSGTFKLPQSQIDRFIISFSLGYPDSANERDILLNRHNDEAIESLDSQTIDTLRQKSHNVHVSDKLIDYIMSIVDFTRQSQIFEYGLSTRGALALVSMSRAWALIEERDYVIDDDVATILPYVIRHRLKPINNDVDSLDEIYKAVNRY